MHQVHNYFYVFIRQDLPLAQQLVQSCHATHAMATQNHSCNTEEIPSTIVIGVPNQKALLRVIKKLQKNNIKFAEFHEPDFDMGLSAIATVPLVWSERQCLKDYSIWREPKNVQENSSMQTLQQSN